jgi:hypothetical protein
MKIPFSSVCLVEAVSAEKSVRATMRESWGIIHCPFWLPFQDFWPIRNIRPHDRTKAIVQQLYRHNCLSNRTFCSISIPPTRTSIV